MPQVTIMGPDVIRAFVNKQLDEKLVSDVRTLIKQDPKAMDLFVKLVQVQTDNELPENLLELLDKRYMAKV